MFLIFKRQNNSKKILIIAGALALVIFIVLIGFFWQKDFKETKATSSDNVRGWGWSENLGWISMNCYNDYDHDGDFENCCSGGSNPSICPGGLAGGDYGVKYDTTENKLTGWAWSDRAGWICFGETCKNICLDGSKNGDNCNSSNDCPGGVCGGEPPQTLPFSWACIGKATWKCSGGTNNGNACFRPEDCPDGVCQFTCLGDKAENFVDTLSCSTNTHLKAHWKMNTVTNGIITDEKGINPGTLYPTNAPPTLIKGKFGNALKFDGVDDYVEVNDSESLSIIKNLDIEVWVKRGDINREQTIVAKWDESADKNYRLWFDANNRLNFTVSDGVNTATVKQKDGVCLGQNAETTSCLTNNDCANGEICRNAPIIDTKKWHHLAAKFVAQNLNISETLQRLQLFIDGERAPMEITGTVPNTLTDGSQKLYLGAKKGTSIMETHFSGSMDNVSIWSCQQNICQGGTNNGNPCYVAEDCPGGFCVGKYLGRHPDDIWDDAKIEVDGWARIINLGSRGWLKLRGFTQDGRVWGSSLNSFAPFYTFDGYMANRYIDESVSSNGLVGQWKMNEPPLTLNNTTITDSSVNANNGTAKNGLTTVNRGLFYKAIDLNGVDDCVTIPDSSTLDIANNLTLGAWIFNEGPGAESTSTLIGMIVAKHYTNNSRSYDLHIDHTTSKIKFEIFEPNNTGHFLISNSAIEKNKWYYIVATYDKASGLAKIYINGALDISTTFGSYDLMQTNIPATIGCYLNSTDGTSLRSFFKGLIDNVTIYNRAKTIEEIQADYAKRIPHCAGWDEYGHIYGEPPAPLPFDNVTINNTQGCEQLLVGWDVADWAESYTYWRCDDKEEYECNTCSYTEKSVLDGSCGSSTCSLSDTNLSSNTGYCYKIQAHNETGSTYNSEGPVWKSTLLCAPITGGINVEICGQLTINWENIPDSDGYNVYRSLSTGSLATDGCNNVYNSGCELVGHVAESVDYDADKNQFYDLIANWRMNETSWTGAAGEVRDSSGNGYHGTASIGATTTSNGRFNYAGAFDGNDYVTVAHNEQFDLGTGDNLTIEGWIYLTSTPTNYEMILSKGYSPGYEFRINTSQYLQFLNVAPGYSSYALTSNSVLQTGNWHHVAVTKNNTTGETKIYIDGVLDKTDTLDTLDYSNNNEIRIGRDADDGAANGNAYFKGYIDNLAVYSVIKSAEQIRMDYEAGNCGLSNCELSNVCHIQGVNDDKCGKTTNDPTTCCYTDSRVIPFIDYYYVITSISNQGESEPGPSTPLSGKTICFPPLQEQEE